MAAATTAAGPATARAASPALLVTPALTFAGRTLVILGGAFLLRAVTEAGIVPPAAGMAAGLGYAFLCILLADRAAAGGKRASAAFHGLAGVLVAFPLVVESTLKLHQWLSPGVGAVALAASAALALGVAWRRTLATLAWFATLGTLVAALAMTVATRAFFPFTACTILLGLATLWLGYARGWSWLAGVAAVAADALVLLVGLVCITTTKRVTPAVIGPVPVLVLQWGLAGFYFGSFVWRSVWRRRDLGALEILQAAATVVIGVGGALGVARAVASFGVVAGGAGLGLGLGCYGLAFLFSDRDQGHRTNFLFYSTMALVLALAALNTLLPGQARAMTYAALSLLTAWLGTHRGRVTLSGHGAFYAAAAALRSGLLPAALIACFGPRYAPMHWATASGFVVLAVTIANGWFEVAKHGRTWGRLSHLPKVVVLLLLCAIAGGIAVTAMANALHVGPGASVPVLAVIRTGVLALAAIALAGLGRLRRFLEAAWLVYPVLGAGALKLLVEDLRQGSPGTAFGSLVLYGIALILAPRLLRRVK